MADRQTMFEAIGTRWHISCADKLTDEAWATLLQQIADRIAQFDAAYSRFRDDSQVSRMARQGGRYKLPADGPKLLTFYERLYRATAGKVTPLIGQVMSDAGYDASYSFAPRTLQAPPAWDDVISYSGTDLTLHRPCSLDFGAAGKGYLVDIIGELLQRAGLRTYTINAGGDILHRSAENQTQAVGLENPADSSEAIGIARLENGSLCASAGNKRRWHQYTHIIDPVTLASPAEIISTWVIAADTITADGLATALFFTAPVALRQFFDFGFALLHRDMTLEYSPDFPVKVFEAA